MTNVFFFITITCCLLAVSFSFNVGNRNINRINNIKALTLKTHQKNRSMKLDMGARNRAWAKGELSDKDIFDDDEASATPKKDKMKLEPESTFFEGPPSATEVFLPALSILTIIGIVPFISALSRQAWVRYKFTSRRVSIQSGIGGKTQTEIIYPDIEQIRFVYRAFGAAGDMVMFLKDGAKVELRHVPNFTDIYTFVLSKCDEECREKSMKLAPSSENK